MKAKNCICRKCGENAIQASKRGSYLARVNEKGVPAINECRPSCEHLSGNQDNALIHAMAGD